MTFNTQHCAVHPTGRIDIALFAKYISKADADIVGLNEIRGEGPAADYTAQTEQLREGSGMPYGYFAPALLLRDGPYGNAMLSKLPIVSIENIPIPDPEPKGYNGYYETRCLIKARLECGLTVLISHFGLNPDEQESAVRTVVENLEEEKCLLMGDFNVTPENPVLDPIRARMRDTAELSKTPLLTFPSDAPKIKIDYIFVSPDIRVRSVEVPKDVVSDHLTYIADIEYENEQE